jgi:hypothetical protein
MKISTACNLISLNIYSVYNILEQDNFFAGKTDDLLMCSVLGM